MSSCKDIAAEMGVITGTMSSASFFTDRFTRTGVPRRVNPFQIEAGNAPSEETNPHNWTDFEGYLHTILNIGEDVRHTPQPGSILIEWDAAPGFESAVCNYLVYWKVGTASSEPISSPVNTEDAAGALSYVINTAPIGSTLAVCVGVVFNDNASLFYSGGFPGDLTENELTGSDQGILTEPVPST